MDLNATLIVEVITFSLFVWITLKFIWPPVVRAMEKRKATIAEGLASAQKGEKALEEAEAQAQGFLKEAREKAAAILRQAEERAGAVVDEARVQARNEADVIIQEARQDVANQVRSAQQEIQNLIAGLALKAAGQVIRQEMDDQKHRELVAKMLKDWS